MTGNYTIKIERKSDNKDERGYSSSVTVFEMVVTDINLRAIVDALLPFDKEE